MKNDIGKGHEMTLVRVLNAPRSEVWHAWTDPRLLQKWWGPRFFTNPFCEWNATPGGNINVLMQADDTDELGPFRGMKAPMGGQFLEVVAPSKLVFITTALREGEVMLENLNTVTFEESGERTKMMLHVKVQDVKPAMLQALNGMEQGWSQSFEKLAELLA